MTCESRYYLSSLTEVQSVSRAIRHHWAIENKPHWILDVQFGEDGHRARKNHSAEKLAVVRRTALHLLQQDSSNKMSIRRRKCAPVSIWLTGRAFYLAWLILKHSAIALPFLAFSKKSIERKRIL